MIHLKLTPPLPSCTLNYSMAELRETRRDRAVLQLVETYGDGAVLELVPVPDLRIAIVTGVRSLA
jgi:hypothetical protein